MPVKRKKYVNNNGIKQVKPVYRGYMVLLTFAFFIIEAAVLVYINASQYYEPETVKMWWGDQGENIAAIVPSGSYLYHVYVGGEKIVIYEKLTGKKVKEFRTKGAITGAPMDNGEVAVLCKEPFRAEIYSYDRKLREVLFSGLIFPGKISVDAEKNFYISDSRLAVVFKFRENGEKIFEVKVAPDPARSVWGGAASADKEGNLYLIDNNRIISVYNRDGVFVRKWKAFQMKPGNMLNEILASPDGLLYVLDRNGHRVFTFKKNGNLVGRFSRSLDSGHYFKLYCPYFLAADSEYLFVETRTFINVYRMK